MSHFTLPFRKFFLQVLSFAPKKSKISKYANFNPSVMKLFQEVKGGTVKGGFISEDILTLVQLPNDSLI